MTYVPDFDLPEDHVYVVNVSGECEVPGHRVLKTGDLWHMHEDHAATLPTEGHIRWKVLGSLDEYTPPAPEVDESEQDESEPVVATPRPAAPAGSALERWQAARRPLTSSDPPPDSTTLGMVEPEVKEAE